MSKYRYRYIQSSDIKREYTDYLNEKKIKYEICSYDYFEKKLVSEPYFNGEKNDSILSGMYSIM